MLGNWIFKCNFAVQKYFQHPKMQQSGNPWTPDIFNLDTASDSFRMYINTTNTDDVPSECIKRGQSRHVTTGRRHPDGPSAAPVHASPRSAWQTCGGQRPGAGEINRTEVQFKEEKIGRDNWSGSGCSGIDQFWVS